MHYVQYKKWWDTKSFKQAGNSWLEHNYYCPFSPDSNAYTEYWEEQEHYIKNGFVHEGQRIAGLHYLYTNYCPIKIKKIKKLTLPDFWALDADYFLEMESVLGLRPGMTQQELWDRDVVFSASKTRQSGASLKGVVPLLYNMEFVPFSSNYIGAYLKKDAIKTNNMFMKYFDHCFKYTDFGKRFMKKDADNYYQTGYYETIDSEKSPAGFQSELSIISFQDSSEKGVGGGCDLFIIEEAGMHPELLQSITFISPACREGDYTTGNILVYGAAGKEGQCEDLQKLHYNPKSYKAKAYENKWDAKKIYPFCGYFIPNYSCRAGHIDIDGNPNCESAIIARDKSLEELKKSDIVKYNEELSQFPNDGTEMFGGRGRKRYDTKIIDQAIALLLSKSIYGDAIDLYENITTGRIEFSISNNTPIREYPTPAQIDTTGCVEMFEPPPLYPPDFLYIASIDSYNQDDSTTTSLGCIQIFKRLHNLSSENTNRVLVAEYVGRPTGPFGKYEFYKTCANLLKLYNAVCLPENEDSELTPWFYNNNMDHLLADQPDIIRSIVPNSTTKRLKGIHASTPLITAAENKIARYLYELLGKIHDDEGKVIEQVLGVRRIPSLGLLRELREYSTTGNKNFDRVRTFGWLLLYEDETAQQEVKETVSEEEKSFLHNPKRLHKKGKTKLAYAS